MPGVAESNLERATGLRTATKSLAWLEFALILAVFFVAGGAPAPHVNETHYLTKAKHYWDPTFCPGDAFLDSADAHLAFYWTFGWLTQWLSLGATAWVGRIAAWTLIALGWMRLSRAATVAPWAAVVSVIVWIAVVDNCDFAGEWVVGGLVGKGGVEGKCFAYGFVLLGLAALLAGRWTTPWIWFGAAAAMHALVGGWAVLAGFCVWLAEPKLSRPRISTLLPGLVVGGVLSLPGLLPALALDREAPGAVAHEAARIYVYERLPHHLAPLTLPSDEFARRVLRFSVPVAGLVGLALLLSTRRRPTSASFEPDSRLGAWRRCLTFAAAALACNCMGLIVELLLDGQPLTAAPLLRYYWFRQADVLVPAAVALVATALALESGPAARPWARFALAAGLLLCTAHLMRIAVERVRNPVPPALVRIENPAAWLAACNWIRQHAPPDALCLIPRHAQSFKWYAHRGDVVNWKDIPQDAVGVVEWRERLHDVFPTIELPDGPRTLGSPEQLSESRLRVLATRYGASYVIARSEPVLGLPEVFVSGAGDEEGGYSIYEIGAAEGSGEP
jgi:hypothetical protein